jgi:hypothetical protein
MLQFRLIIEEGHDTFKKFEKVLFRVRWHDPACLIVAVADSTRWLQANSAKARNMFVSNIELHQKAAAWVDHQHQHRVAHSQAQDALARKDKLIAEEA